MDIIFLILAIIAVYLLYRIARNQRTLGHNQFMIGERLKQLNMKIK